MDRLGLCVLIAITVVTATPFKSNTPLASYYYTPCNVTEEDTLKSYRRALDEFVVTVFNAASCRTNLHFLNSATSMYATISAIAEGANLDTQNKLFKLLNLPEDPCVRQQYYQLLTSRLHPSKDVHISNTRNIVVDDDLSINVHWYSYITKHSLMCLISASMKATNEVSSLISTKLSNVNPNGGYMLLEEVDFKGLWDIGFSSVERSAFYSATGKKIGYVDLMRMRKFVKMGYIQDFQAKAMQLPIGSDGRYSILYFLVDEEKDALKILKKLKGSIIAEVTEVLRESTIPIEIGIPQYTMTAELNVKEILEDLGVKDLWINPDATRFVSPEALPSSYVQRVTVSFNTTGVNPPPNYPSAPADAATGLDPRVGREFIANRPFIFGIFDTETHSCLIASAFSQPTYSL